MININIIVDAVPLGTYETDELCCYVPMTQRLSGVIAVTVVAVAVVAVTVVAVTACDSCYCDSCYCDSCYCDSCYCHSCYCHSCHQYRHECEVIWTDSEIFKASKLREANSLT